MPRNLNQKDTSILIGNALDHYDSAIYGFLGPILAPVFFPNYEPIVQLILVYSVLSTSLVTRPVGSFIFGLMARRYGPISGMSYSLIGVSLSTVFLGFLPSYEDVGWLAPAGLILIRMVKGVFAAGESTIAKLYIMENKASTHALKASYLYQSSSMLGTILASGAVTLVLSSNDEAWRLCFWVGGITGLVGYLLRRYSSSPTETKVFDSYQLSSLVSLWRNRTNILCVAMGTGFGHMTGTLPFVFMNSFVPLITTISFETMMILNTGLLAFDMLLIPLLGRFTLRYEGVKVMVFASMVLTISIIPLFVFLPDASLGYVVFVRVWIVFWGVAFMCPMNFWFKGLFSSSERYLLVGMGGALGATTLGRMTTPLCLWIWYASGVSFAPAVYVAIIMCLTAYVIYAANPKLFHMKQFIPQTTGA
ncbi:MAG: MFS transporter [Proteobacteria bacterium]|nr:MFS transporter [Pseudomonadota bacterium]